MWNCRCWYQQSWCKWQQIILTALRGEKEVRYAMSIPCFPLQLIPLSYLQISLLPFFPFPLCPSSVPGVPSPDPARDSGEHCELPSTFGWRPADKQLSRKWCSPWYCMSFQTISHPGMLYVPWSLPVLMTYQYDVSQWFSSQTQKCWYDIPSHPRAFIFCIISSSCCNNSHITSVLTRRGPMLFNFSNETCTNIYSLDNHWVPSDEARCCLT